MPAMLRSFTAWRKNSFKVPAGNSGKSFISEIARLFRAFAEKSALESVAMKAVTVLAILALQKPFQTSKTKDHVSCLVRRLVLWKDGNLNDLVLEGIDPSKSVSRESVRAVITNSLPVRSPI